jgi:hypothetical protein
MIQQIQETENNYLNIVSGKKSSVFIFEEINAFKRQLKSG